MKIQLAVIFGGKSVEHEISIISAIQAIRHLDTQKYDIYPVYITKQQEFYVGEDIAKIEAYADLEALKKRSRRVIFINDNNKTYLIDHPFEKHFKKYYQQIDVVLPVVHGTNVEDGTLQGYLRTVGVPFAGCGVYSSAIGMDKHAMKTVLRDAGIPVLDCLIFNRQEYTDSVDTICNSIEDKLNYPVIVKPANLGSSIGISKAKNIDELKDAIELAFSFAAKVIVERAIESLREINCSVIGDSDNATASECEEPLNATNILSYEDKYMGNSKSKGGNSQGMASLSRQIPANISSETRATIRDLAVKTFRALECNGLSRIDFMIDTSTNDIFVNEINTIPGSLSFYLWEPLGIPYQKLLDKLIQLALKKERDEKNISYTFDTNVLSQCSSDALGGSKTKLNV